MGRIGYFSPRKISEAEAEKIGMTLSARELASRIYNALDPDEQRGYINAANKRGDVVKDSSGGYRVGTDYNLD